MGTVLMSVFAIVFFLCFFSVAAANVVALFGGYAQTVTDSFFFFVTPLLFG